VCSCEVSEGQAYCSQDCEQAASQGAEREFCQCPHSGCRTSDGTRLELDPAALRESFRFFSRGAITISYSDLDDLTRQVLALAAALSHDERQQGNGNVDAELTRRPVASQSVSGQVKSRTA